MEKLLRSSARATAETIPEYQRALHPIRVALCADERQVVIRISDRGGGMPFDPAKQLWSYMFTDAAARSSSPDKAPPNSSRPWGVAEQSPITGRTIGLLLCRLYARELGGNLEIINLPGLGVDAYLYLNRMDFCCDLPVGSGQGSSTAPTDDNDDN